MSFKLFHVDAFTQFPFSGNPAAVCILPSPADETWMGRVAAEINLSETAFVGKRDDGFYFLRWFAPKGEVDLCGHATLASAYVLWDEGFHPIDQDIQFLTNSGNIICKRSDNWIQMNFPIIEYKEEDLPVGMIDSLGIKPKFCAKTSLNDYLLEADSEFVLEKLSPNFRKLQEFPCRGVIVTAPANGNDFDFVSRFFAPSIGIEEDHVTGSSHCSLGTFWSEKLSKKKLIAKQISERGGIIKISLGKDKITLSGQAVTLMRCELF
ncbi:MAG: PhzF family phenazine biosynthesis protein [Nitrospinota bacterium]|nr:PhzF family phenazine biosynthesis protein [Nitrospinota bacterium]